MLKPALARGAVRVSLGWSSEPDDIDRFVDSWLRAHRRRRLATSELVNVDGASIARFAAVES